MGIVGWFTGTKYGRWLIGAVLFVLALFGIYRKVQDDAIDAHEADTLRADARGMERGRNAVAEEKDATRDASHVDLVERLRSRDGEWR